MKKAFYQCRRPGIFDNKEIIGLNFEEGVEEIGQAAFIECEDIEQKTIKLPNSVKFIGNKAFRWIIEITSLDLTSLDHVINLDCSIDDYDASPLSWYVKKIYVKDEAMKAKYSIDNNWKAYANKILVK